MDSFDISKVFSGRTPQVLAVVTGTLTALSDGMQYGWSAPIIPVLQSPSSPISITHSDIMWIENLYMFGGLTGIPITMYLLDKVGRKGTMLVSTITNVLAWLLIIFASSVELILVARFITGLAADTNFVATPVYIAEISDKEIRGRLASLIYIMMMIGILLIYIIGPFVSISASSSVGLAILIVELLTFSFMPESPYYLLVHNKKDEARRSLQILRSSKDVEDELEEIAGVVQKENKARGRPLELLTVKSNRKAFLIMCALSVAQHYSSISVMLMNIHIILNDAATLIPASITAIVFSFLMLVACVVSALLIDSVGRRVLLNSSCFLTGFSLLLLASYFAVKNSDIDVTAYNWVPALAVMLYAVTFKCGLGLIPIVMTAELYPTNVKAIGCTITDAVYVVAGSSSIYLFHFFQDHYGMHVPFFIFGCCCLLTGLFSISCIPETKGKTLEDIQKILKGETQIANGNCRKDEKHTLLSSCDDVTDVSTYGTVSTEVPEIVSL